MLYLRPALRRIVCVASFELIAIFFASALLSGMSGGDMGSSLPVAVGVSVIAVIWNYLYNSLFEAWENNRGIRTRTFRLRMVHTLLFEAGFILLAVPLFMWWYKFSFANAFMMELGILVFFFCYTFMFTWAFDKVFIRFPKVTV